MLSNGMGGLDWAGLPTVSTFLGITDIEAFVDRLMVIKLHRPDQEAPDAGPSNTVDQP